MQQNFHVNETIHFTEKIICKNSKGCPTVERAGSGAFSDRDGYTQDASLSKRCRYLSGVNFPSHSTGTHQNVSEDL